MSTSPTLASSPRCPRCRAVLWTGGTSAGTGGTAGSVGEDEFVDVNGSLGTLQDKLNFVCCMKCENELTGKVRKVAMECRGNESTSTTTTSEYLPSLQDLENELIQLRRQEHDLALEESRFETEHCALASFSKQVRESLEAQKVRVKGLKAELNLLDRDVVPAVAFKTGYVETDNVRYGTINGLRLGGPHSHTGRTTTSGPPWEEVSCAWGEIALFVSRAAKILQHDFKDYDVIPMGGKSTIRPKMTTTTITSSLLLSRPSPFNLFYISPTPPSTTTQWFGNMSGHTAAESEARLAEFNRAIMGLSVCLNELCVLATSSSATNVVSGVDFNPIKQVFAVAASPPVAGAAAAAAVLGRGSPSMTSSTLTSATNHPPASTTFSPYQPQVLVDVLFKDLSICLKDTKNDSTRWTAACGLLLINVTALMVWISKKKATL